MESHNCFPASARLKRKCDDSETVLELFQDVSISPHSKRLRQVDLHDQLSMEPISCTTDVDRSDQLLSDPLPAPVSDERAIVLYKPVNPPLFLGGPNTGSQLLLNANILESGILHPSNWLQSRKENDLPWFPARKSGMRIADLTEEEGHRESQDDHLAVVPWNSSSPINMLALQAEVQPSNEDNEEMMSGDENIGVEAMEEDDERRMDVVNLQQNSPTFSFYYEPWQQYGAPPKPQYTSLMWSH